MNEPSTSIQRYDSLVRSERYFTATLLPFMLLHDDRRGVRGFLEIVDQRAKTERSKSGELQPKVLIDYDFSDVQVITEFHIERDLKSACMPLEVVKGQKRDAPDVVIVAGEELIVCEGKFFSGFGRVDLNKQLLSQRRQVRHLFRHRPDLRAYRHVAILPAVLEGHVDADAVLTWADIGNLAENLLGAAHYVTQRLREAVKMYNQQLAANPGSGPNYEEMLPFDLMVRRCQQSGTEIWVGHDKGEANLRTWSAARIAGKKWKYRTPQTGGAVDPRNWLPASRWLEIVTDPTRNASASPPRAKSDGRRYERPLSFERMRQKCQQEGNAISVGYMGGAAKLRQLPAADAMKRLWKYRTPQNSGETTPRNWLPAALWLEIVDGLTQSPIGL